MEGQDTMEWRERFERISSWSRRDSKGLEVFWISVYGYVNV